MPIASLHTAFSQCREWGRGVYIYIIYMIYPRAHDHEAYTGHHEKLIYLYHPYLILGPAPPGALLTGPQGAGAPEVSTMRIEVFERYNAAAACERPGLMGTFLENKPSLYIRISVDDEPVIEKTIDPKDTEFFEEYEDILGEMWELDPRDKGEEPEDDPTIISDYTAGFYHVRAYEFIIPDDKAERIIKKLTEVIRKAKPWTCLEG